jgi:hypothetical protein
MDARLRTPSKATILSRPVRRRGIALADPAADWAEEHPGVSSLFEESQASNRSCDSYSKIQGALLEATNHEFEGKKLTLRITDVRLIGVSPPPDKDYCLVEVGTNVGLQLEMKYHIEENGHIQAELVLNTSSSVRP